MKMKEDSRMFFELPLEYLFKDFLVQLVLNIRIRSDVVKEPLQESGTGVGTSQKEVVDATSHVHPTTIAIKKQLWIGLGLFNLGQIAFNNVALGVGLVFANLFVNQGHQLIASVQGTLKSKEGHQSTNQSAALLCQAKKTRWRQRLFKRRVRIMILEVYMFSPEISWK